MKELYQNEEVKQEVKTSKDSKDSKVASGIAYRVLVRPLITEKATELSSLNKYAFEVCTDANKIEVAQAVKEVYGIKPVSVNILKMKGKKVVRGRYTGKRKDWKKAIVTLPKGKTIRIYEGI
ncbi:50S ribosomal protein L23 [Candidatus Falkowbacteria bacterium]|nr:50S ribosomal protein L23 [Candidatus Falkowbacteria bacterium]